MKREEVNSPEVAHTVATWDDETGDAELLEYGHDGRIRRRAAISHWHDVEDAKAKLERRPILRAG